jgi:hypothetical protein
MTTRAAFDFTFTQAVDTPDGPETTYSRPVDPGISAIFSGDPVAGTQGTNGTCVRFGGGSFWNLGSLESVAFDRGSSATTITVVARALGEGPGDSVTIHVPPTADPARYMVEFMEAGGAGAHGNWNGYPLSLIQTMQYPGEEL